MPAACGGDRCAVGVAQVGYAALYLDTVAHGLNNASILPGLRSGSYLAFARTPTPLNHAYPMLLGLELLLLGSMWYRAVCGTETA